MKKLLILLLFVPFISLSQDGTAIDQDGNSFQYLNISTSDSDNQTWSLENAKVTSYRDGTPIPQVQDPIQFNNANYGAWRFIDSSNDSEIQYNGYAVKGIYNASNPELRKNIAPVGWKVPDLENAQTIINYISQNYNWDGSSWDGSYSNNKIAKALASTEGWSNSSVPGSPGFDSASNNGSQLNMYPWGFVNGSTPTTPGFSIYYWLSSGMANWLDHMFIAAANQSLFISQTNTFGNLYLDNGLSIRFFTNDFEIPSISAPPDIEFISNSVINNICGLNGTNGDEIFLGNPNYSDNIGVSEIYSDAPTFFPIGTHTVTWTVIDDYGYVNTDTQLVTVYDNTNPTITAPDSVSVSTNEGCTATEFSLGTAIANDDCLVASITNDAPSAFQIGETTVTWTVTDESGNTSTDTQQVLVIDESGPNVICNDITLTLENGIAEISLEDIDNGSFDACEGDINLSISQSSFNESHIGDNTVILTATDQYGNSSSCASNVIVEAGMSLVENSLSSISLFPNPSSDLVYIKGHNDINLKVSVFDISGKKILEFDKKNSFDISLFEIGVYFVNISDGIKTVIQKIIKK